jgi:hypothetical protein
VDADALEVVPGGGSSWCRYSTGPARPITVSVGNALLEAFWHRRPVLVNRYPAYVRDIAPTGVDCIEIDGELSAGTVERAAKVLVDPRQWDDPAERNYEAGRRHFSFAVARRRLLPLVAAGSPVRR